MKQVKDTKAQAIMNNVKVKNCIASINVMLILNYSVVNDPPVAHQLKVLLASASMQHVLYQFFFVKTRGRKLFFCLIVLKKADVIC
jgi:hypothetical protein